jgi:hypothetical protein
MRKISYSEYLKLFNGREEAAWKKAWEIRNFEIELYWKRATYFWAFIAASFIGYISLITSDSYNKYLFNKYPQVEFLIICLGFMLSNAWYLANVASKKWQENWEKHIDLLEPFVTGPIYQTLKHTSNYSVSKLNKLISFFFIFIWIGLSVLFFIRHNYIFYCKMNYHPDYFVLFSTVFTIVLLLLMIFKSGKTDFSNKKFSFYIRQSIYK